MKIYKYLYKWTKNLKAYIITVYLLQVIMSRKGKECLRAFFPQNEIQEFHMIVLSGRIVSELIYIYT